MHSKALTAIFLFIITSLTSISLIHAQDRCVSETGEIATFEWRLTDFCQRTVELVEIQTVIGKDDIPSIDDPQMESIAAASQWLRDRSPVIVVEIAGEVRAYPLAVLIYHEIANDIIDDFPIAITYCPLCNSAIVFDRRVGDETLSFGVSGNLRHSDLIMYDHQTESWWQQFVGEAIVGDYVGTLLDVIPSQVVGFAQFAERFPDGQVLARPRTEQGRLIRDYGNNPYPGYIDRGPFDRYIDEDNLDPRYEATGVVLAGIINGQAMAYPFSTLAEEVVINDSVAGLDVVVFWQSGQASAIDNRLIDNSMDVGTAAIFRRELDGQILTFIYDGDEKAIRQSTDGNIRDLETGSTWNIFGEAIDGELAGESLDMLIAAPHLWFAWMAFHPQTAFYEA